MKVVLNEEIDRFNNLKTDEEKTDIIKKICEYIREKKVVIYGAGAVGSELLECFKAFDIKVECFVDKKHEDINEIDGIKVYPINKLKEFNQNDVLLIISIDTVLFLEFKQEIYDNIEKYCSSAQIVTYGRDIVLTLRYQICREKLERGEKLDIIKCINCGCESRKCEFLEKYLREISIKSNKDKSKLRLNENKFFGYILGNICNLKCKHCCEMVPYYDSKKFANKDDVINECAMMANAAKFTMYIELIGGEPFLHPDIADILEGLLNIPDVGYIKIFTNGTVLPDDRLCGVLKNPRIVVMWSNYKGMINQKLWDSVEKTRMKFDKEGINYIYSMSRTWLDFSSFEYVEKSKEDLENDFKDCFISNCHRIHEGVLYRCPHQYAAIRLGKIKCVEGDCVDLNSVKTIEELSKKLYDFKNQKYVEACKYCVVPYKANEVEAGEQLEN